MKNYEKKFFTLEELFSFLEERKKTDEWTFPFTKELKVVGYSNIPLFKEETKEKMENLQTDESGFDECLEDSGLFLILPDKEGTALKTVPMNSSGLNSLYERAGLGGRTITLLTNKNDRNCLTPEEKAVFLSRGLDLDHGNTRVLIREGRVATLRSDKYVILPELDLLTELNRFLNNEYIEYSFSDASVTYELTVADFHCVTAESENIRKMLEADSAACIFRFITGDVGNSSVQIYPVIRYSKKKHVSEIMLSSLSIKHYGDASVETFTEKLPQMACVTRFQEDLSKLYNHKVKYSADVLRNIAYELGLPKDMSLQVADEFGALYPSGANATDVYSWLFEIVGRLSCSLAAQLKYKDLILRALNMDYAAKDYPFEWK